MTINILLITFRRDTFISDIIDCLSSHDVKFYVYSNFWYNEESKMDVLRTRALIQRKVLEGKVHHTFFRDQNLPVELSIPFAIDWFFNSVQKGIILEDDCIPTPNALSVFTAALSKIDDNKLTHINFNYKLSNPQQLLLKHQFCNVKLVNVWGWASNSNTWFTSKSDKLAKFTKFLKYFDESEIKRRHATVYYLLYLLNYLQLIKTWDFVYAVNVLCSGANILQVYPSVITNTGVDHFASNHKFDHKLNNSSENMLIGDNYDTFLLKNLYKPMLFNLDVRRIRKLIRLMLEKLNK